MKVRVGSTHRRAATHPTVRAIVAVLAGVLFAAPGHASAALFQGSFEGFPVTLGDENGRLTEIAQGTEHSIWFIEHNPSAVNLVRINSAGIITGEFPIPTGKQKGIPEEASPEALTLGPDGNMWFSDSGSNSEGDGFIGRISPSGKIVEFPIPAATPPKPSGPSGIAVGPEGNLWFTERLRGTIDRITPTGAFLDEFAIPTGTADNLPKESEPQAIALGADGRMWFIDENFTGEHFIGSITAGGTVEEVPVPLPWEDTLYSITAGTDGNMWFTAGSFGLSRPPESFVGRIAPAGTITLFQLPTVNGAYLRMSSALEGIVAGQEGDLWFPLQNAGLAVGRVSKSGTIDVFSAPTTNGTPGSMTMGDDGELWLTDTLKTTGSGAMLNHIWRFTPPSEPRSIVPPSLSGQATVGQTLTASEGTWANKINALTYQWQLCDSAGGDCSDLPADNNPTLLLSGDFVDHRLRAIVTASGPGGIVSATSDISEIVAALKPASMPPPKPVAPLPVVGATMTWRFREFPGYTILQSLVAHRLPPGGSLQVTCRGVGCAFRSKHMTVATTSKACSTKGCRHRRRSTAIEMDLTKLFRGRRLHPGTRISVSIDKSGWVGKEFVFTIRDKNSPRVDVTCMAPGVARSRSPC
jgi:streptogramin lyase